MQFRYSFRPFLFLLILLAATSVQAQTNNLNLSDWQNRNTALAADIASSRRGINSSIIDAMKLIPRHLFADESYGNIAYEDIALPGADNGFISSPTDTLAAIGMLSPSTGDKILIAGNNTGYSAAILSRLAQEIYVIEETSAAGYYTDIFNRLEIENIRIAESPDINEFTDIFAFDKIFICGAVPEVSEKITERLAIQGNITFILAEDGGFQQIVSLRRSLLGDSIACAGSCYFPEIEILKITN